MVIRFCRIIAGKGARGVKQSFARALNCGKQYANQRLYYWQSTSRSSILHIVLPSTDEMLHDDPGGATTVAPLARQVELPPVGLMVLGLVGFVEGLLKIGRVVVFDFGVLL